MHNRSTFVQRDLWTDSMTRSCNRAAGTLVIAAMLAVVAIDARAQTSSQKGEIWERADPAVMSYIQKSAAATTQGFALAYTGFGDWYTNTLAPAVKNEPAFVAVAKFVFTKGLALLPNALGTGPFVSLAVDFFASAFEEATASTGDEGSMVGFLAKLNAEMENAKAGSVALAERFEEKYPSDFEAAMFAYLNEELGTPGIHAASDFRVGAATRKKLKEFGFPEPSETGARLVAESVLTPMILAAQTRYFPDRLKVLTENQKQINAQVTARRILFPKNAAYYCKDAWQLGLLQPDDCR